MHNKLVIILQYVQYYSMEEDIQFQVRFFINLGQI
jgi:hypothetical protein